MVEGTFRKGSLDVFQFFIALRGSPWHSPKVKVCLLTEGCGPDGGQAPSSEDFAAVFW